MISDGGGGLPVGLAPSSAVSWSASGLTLSEIGELWTTAPPVVAEWLRFFASPLIRNRATLGGNLATARLSGWLPAVSLRVTVCSASHQFPGSSGPAGPLY